MTFILLVSGLTFLGVLAVVRWRARQCSNCVAISLSKTPRAPPPVPGMGMRVRFAISLPFVLVLALLVAAPARAEVRALLLASDYSTAGNPDLALSNTLMDARSVAAMLRKLGLQDLRLAENPSPDSWNSELESLARRLQGDDVALLYYAGHAVQISGRNFFLASDGNTLISSEEVLSTIMARSRGTIFLIDACRDNPFRDAGADRTHVMKIGAVTPTAAGARGSSRAMSTVSMEELARASDGLSQMGNLRGKNIIVLFSTDPGNVELDGDPGGGSPFANAVVRELWKRQSLYTAIRRITAEVDKQTGSRQSPWRQGDLMFSLFLAGQPRFPVP